MTGVQAGPKKSRERGKARRPYIQSHGSLSVGPQVCEVAIPSSSKRLRLQQAISIAKLSMDEFGRLVLETFKRHQKIKKLKRTIEAVDH